jgi:hypothetical protein
VLGAVVRLLTDATSVHACFVYLVEDDRLVLAAASEPYAHLVGRIALERGEGSPGRPPAQGPRGSATSSTTHGEVRPRARRGALPVARIRPDRGQGRQRHRRHLEPYRGAARVHRGRGGRARLQRLARRRGDRERPPLRGDAPARRRARAPRRAGELLGTARSSAPWPDARPARAPRPPRVPRPASEELERRRAIPSPGVAEPRARRARPRARTRRPQHPPGDSARRER